MDHKDIAAVPTEHERDKKHKNIASYLRSKKKDREAKETTIKSEVYAEFKPQFVDIKELAKSSPAMALACMSVGTLSKSNRTGVHADKAYSDKEFPQDKKWGYSAIGTSPAGSKVRTANHLKESPQDKHIASRLMTEAKAMHRQKLKELKDMPKPNLGKVSLTPTPKMPKQTAMPKGNPAATKTLAVKPPKKPSMAPMNISVTSSMAKGDVVNMHTKKVISTNNKPASTAKVNNQHKASQYSPMKPAPVAADGTRKVPQMDAKETGMKTPPRKVMSDKDKKIRAALDKQKNNPIKKDEMGAGESYGQTMNQAIKSEVLGKWEPKYYKKAQGDLICKEPTAKAQADAGGPGMVGGGGGVDSSDTPDKPANISGTY